MGDELTVAHTPCIPAPLVDRRQIWEGGSSGVKMFLRSYFASHYPVLILLVVNSVSTSNSTQFCL